MYFLLSVFIGCESIRIAPDFSFSEVLVAQLSFLRAPNSAIPVGAAAYSAHGAAGLVLLPA